MHRRTHVVVGRKQTRQHPSPLTRRLERIPLGDSHAFRVINGGKIHELVIREPNVQLLTLVNLSNVSLTVRRNGDRGYIACNGRKNVARETIVEAIEEAHQRAQAASIGL